MTRAWKLRAAPVAMLLVAACQDAPTTPIAVQDDGGGGLTFLVPDIDPAMLVVRSTEGGDSLTTGPAKVLIADPEDPYPDPPPLDPSTLPPSDIWNASTRVGFDAGSAWASGEHSYQGNKGAITTTVTVSLDGVEIGRQSASKVQDTVFWIDFGLPKHIQAIARAFVSQDCGLMARGDSDHEAWWEAVPGATIATFGKSRMTSYSFEPARQPDCAPEPPPPPSGGGGGGGGGEGGYCVISIWYDLYTGEIVDWEVLYCEMGG